MSTIEFDDKIIQEPNNNETEPKQEEQASQSNQPPSGPVQTPPYYTPPSWGQQSPNFDTPQQQPIPTYSPQNSWNYYAGKKPPKKRSGAGKKIVAIVFGSVFLFGILYLAAFGAYNLVNDHLLTDTTSQGVSSSENVQKNESTPSFNIESTPTGSDIIYPDGQLTTKQIAAKLTPSVVGIATYSMEIMKQGEGTGIIMSEDGYIITNAHVISGQGVNKIIVTLYNGDEYEASLIGKDNLTDLAVLKINAKNLVAAAFGDSDKLEVGETVVAIGNPGGIAFAGSVTQGIVSAINRTIAGSENYTMKYIQTDAAINPGNSGGPLVNVYGQVIGINTAKIVASGYEGMCFAIPISTAKPILEDLLKYGYVRNRMKLGVVGQIISKEMADMYGMPRGYRILEIAEESDLDNKGVRVYDIITKINGKEVTSMQVIYEELQKLTPGKTVKLDIYRNERGKVTTFTANVAVYEDKGN